MKNSYTTQDVLDFMDYLAGKGLLKANTANARKSAASALFDVLEQDERLDVREIDLDSLALRFANKQGDKFTPQSLKTYKSRTKSALADFISYRENPLGFSPKSQTRKSSKNKSKTSTNITQGTDQTPDRKTSSSVEVDEFASSNVVIFPIPLRANLTVKIANLPNDLTTAEARKISAVINALAMN